MQSSDSGHEIDSSIAMAAVGAPCTMPKQGQLMGLGGLGEAPVLLPQVHLRHPRSGHSVYVCVMLCDACVARGCQWQVMDGTTMGSLACAGVCAHG